MRPIKIFRPGPHCPAITPAELRRTVDAFDTERAPVALVFGHPKVEDPSFGWAESIDLAADGLLSGRFKEVVTEVKDLVDRRAYTRVSASFHAPASPHNPAPGVYTLKHVGLLGAAAPKVPGLGAVTLADDGEHTVTVEFSEEDGSMKEEELRRQQEALDAQKAALDARKARLDARQAEQDRQAAADRRAAALSFAEGLADDGRVLPAQVKPLAAVIVSLEGVEEEVSFADDDGNVKKESAAGYLRGFLRKAPRVVPLGEAAPGGRGGEIVDFALPPGEGLTVNDRLGDHNRAMAIAAERKIDYVDAVRIVQSGTGGAA